MQTAIAHAAHELVRIAHDGFEAERSHHFVCALRAYFLKGFRVVDKNISLILFFCRCLDPQKDHLVDDDSTTDKIPSQVVNLIDDFLVLHIDYVDCETGISDEKGFPVKDQLQ